MKTFLALAALLALTVPTLASGCSMTSARPEFLTPSCAVAGAPCHYVDFDPCGGSGECIFSLWVYEESNGFAGLQRGDEVRDDTCGGVYPADTIVL